jgi:hypothetical protein
VQVLRSVSCAALLAVCATAEGTGCGSKSDLVIGQNQGVAVPEAGGSGGGTELNDGSPGAAADAALDAAQNADAASGGAMPSGGTTQVGAAGADSCSSGDVAPPGSLLHRYSFNGTGTVAKDTVGTADGDIEPGATLDGNGLVVLDGNTGYVDLPNRLISVLKDVTVVTWMTWLGGTGYERIFDFGVGVGENDTSGAGQSYLAVSPFGGSSRVQLLTKYSAIAELQITSDLNVNDGKEHQVVAVFASLSRAELYVDGQLLGRIPITFSLSDIDDVNDWIGRSQWVDDHAFNGSVDELRIYDQALSACAIQALDDAGPNAL